jgi:hypothetical protein
MDTTGKKSISQSRLSVRSYNIGAQLSAAFAMRPQTSKYCYNAPATSRPAAFVLLGHHDS